MRDQIKSSRKALLLCCSFLCISFAFISGIVNAQGLPEDFPEIDVLVHDEPEQGYIFLTPCGVWGSFPGATPYLAIFDNHGVPVYYRELTQPAFDFKLQANGLLSFSHGGINIDHTLMNSNYEIVGSANITGFSGTDFHEFLILDNGNQLLLGFDDRLVDMDTVVPGGQQGVTVRGTLIQEKNASGNVIWQWSSWGNMLITDTDTSYSDLSGNALIDYVHANALDVDYDGNILVSCRNMHEITKIDKNTGNIIWRMGGSQNMFTFTGEDTNAFSGQHDIRLLDNGNYLLFDNGWYHPDTVSSALEFQIDEVNMTMTVVKRYRSQPDDILGWIMGSSQRLPGGNTLVGWGSGVPNVTEFKPDGTKALEFDYESVSYRAYKYPWKNSIFDVDQGMIEFGEIYYAATSSKSLTLSNKLGEDIIITWMHAHNDKFSIANVLPLTIAAGGTTQIEILFDPQEIGEYSDVLTIYGERSGQSIISAFAQQVEVTGSASEEASVYEHDDIDISIYPNPASDMVHIRRSSSMATLSIQLFTAHGSLISEFRMGNGEGSFDLNIAGLERGVYILSIVDPVSGMKTSRKIIAK